MTTASRSRRRWSATALDNDIIKILSDRTDAMTYVIRNVLAKGSFRKPGSDLSEWHGITTARVLTAWRRLQRGGDLEEEASNYLTQKCWKLSAAGRARAAGSAPAAAAA